MTPAPTIRIHLNLARYRWARLWYILRSLDNYGRGSVTISHGKLQILIGRKLSTIYSQLACARSCGAIRSAHRIGDTWVIYLGGLKAVCRRLKLLDWGATVEISDDELLHNYRATITAAAAHIKQEQSRYQAIQALDKVERERHRIPEAFDVLTAKSKINLPSQATPSHRGKEVDYVLTSDDKCIWVSSSFIPFGGSQEGIAKSIGICDRTVRRHLSKLNVPKKQLMQARSKYKPAYQEAQALGDGQIEVDDSRPQDKEGRLVYIDSRRLVSAGGKIWLRRCNLYALDFQRRTQRATRRELWQLWGIDLNYHSQSFRAYKRQCFKNGHPSKEQIAKIYRRWKEREIASAIDKWNLCKFRAPSDISGGYELDRGQVCSLNFDSFSSGQTALLTDPSTSANRADQPGHF